MEIIIRNILPEDVISVTALSAELGYTVTHEETKGYIHKIIESPSDVAFVAVTNDIVVGWIHVFYTVRLESPPYCEIGGLVVNERYRGGGVGKMLIEHIKPWCREKKCETLRVRTNVKRNEAHKFYDRAGFKEMKQQKVFGIKV